MIRRLYAASHVFFELNGRAFRPDSVLGRIP